MRFRAIPAICLSISVVRSPELRRTPTHKLCNGCENLVYNLSSRRQNCCAWLGISAIFLAEILNGFGFATIRA